MRFHDVVAERVTKNPSQDLKMRESWGRHPEMYAANFR